METSCQVDESAAKGNDPVETGGIFRVPSANASVSPVSTVIEACAISSDVQVSASSAGGQLIVNDCPSSLSAVIDACATTTIQKKQRSLRK